MSVLDPASYPPECVVKYADYLKSKYLQMCVLPNDWPPDISSDQHYTNLALISAESKMANYRTKLASTMKFDYVHGHIDNIVANKKSIELHEVFYPIIDPLVNESRLTILMDGAPGVGKTTITRKLCIEWARGKLLQEYHLVILIPIKEMRSQQNNIAELFPSESHNLALEVVSYYTRDHTNLGKRILWIFDGYDEANEISKLEHSLLSRIMFGKTLQNCSVLVTSRPYASGYLKKHSRFNRHIEVLGFTTQQIVHCIEHNLSDNDKAKKLIQMLKDRLDIISLCYIPLNCRIVLFVYKNLEYELPSTLTQLYTVFILHTIKRHAEKGEDSLDCKEAIRRAKCLTKLPFNLPEKLHALCKLAFSGIEKEKLFFEDEELECKSFLCLGLLNSYETLTTANVQRLFQFLHLTIQEFLAAMYVASDVFSLQDKVTFFYNHINDSRYRMTLLFLAGLSKLDFIKTEVSGLYYHQSFNIHFSGDSDEKQAFFLRAHCAY